MFDLSNYTTVEERIALAEIDHPNYASDVQFQKNIKAIAWHIVAAELSWKALNVRSI
jgi:uncharacterized damage-inducible protein DinB